MKASDLGLWLLAVTGREPLSWGGSDLAEHGAAPMVVVIDDQDDIRNVIAAVLEQGGMSVVDFAGGEQGLEAALTRQPDVVVTDLRMPRLDGLEIARRLTRPDGTRHPPVILVSAHVESLPAADRERYFDAVIPKPVDPAKLMEVVRSLAEPPERPRDR
jgi:CheY-like chemotaxis protein